MSTFMVYNNVWSTKPVVSRVERSILTVIRSCKAAHVVSNWTVGHLLNLEQ